MKDNYLVVAGTMRQHSNTEKVARWYVEQLEQAGKRVSYINLNELPIAQFDLNHKTEQQEAMENTMLQPATKFIFVVPEYNGSFPGALKAWIDCCDVKTAFWGKKAAITGLSSGRNGNLRGMDHLTGVLNYMKINVMHYKVSLPTIPQILNADGQIEDVMHLDMMKRQLSDFIEF